MRKVIRPQRGEVWRADLDPVRGHEQAGTRRILIVSDDLFNSGQFRPGSTCGGAANNQQRQKCAFADHC